MVNFPGRDRRRRVLKDEVLSASNKYTNSRDTDDEAASAPRYSDAAGVEHHPQITDFIPRKYTTIGMLLVVGVGITAALSATHYFAAQIVGATGIHNAATIELSSRGSLISWFSAIVLLVASATCLLTYSIRRHRIDDFRGRYRVWYWAAAACLLLSVNSVAGVHQIVAESLSHLTGWWALRDGAVWWLVLAGLPLTWITLRALLDVRECRVAATLLTAAIGCYAISTFSYLGWARIVDPQVQSIVVGATLSIGNWLVLAAAVSYARFVVLDAQGLIAVRKRSVTKRESKAEPADTTRTTAASAKATATVVSAGTSRQAPPQPAKTPADTSRWVDGSRPERDRYDHEDDEDEDSSEDGHKLSKSDRKRLRKLKTQGRAA
jgi:hypothetical protein